MKLKDRPLDWWIRRSFTYWCRADSNDTTKINYTLNWFSIGQGWEYLNFTSDDEVDGYIMYVLHNSFIHEIQHKDGEWFVTLDYPFFYEHPENDPSVLKTRHKKEFAT